MVRIPKILECIRLTNCKEKEELGGGFWIESLDPWLGGETFQEQKVLIPL